MLAAIIVPLLLGALALVMAQGLQEQQLRQTHLTALSQTLAQAVDGELARVKAQLEVAADSSLIDQGNWQEFYDFGQKIVTKTPGSILILFSTSGGQLVNTRLDKRASLPNFRTVGDGHQTTLWEGRTLPLGSGTLTQQVFETSRVVYSDLYFGVLIKRPSLSLAISRGAKRKSRL